MGYNRELHLGVKRIVESGALKSWVILVLNCQSNVSRSIMIHGFAVVMMPAR